MTRALSLALTLLGCGCSILEPREDPTRFFILSPSSAESLAPQSDAKLTITVGPLRLPAYLLRPEIVRRAGKNQLAPSPVDRWAEPIDGAMLRMLSLDLSTLLPQSSVFTFPLGPNDPDGIQVELDVASFEADTEGSARLVGRWRARSLRQESPTTRDFDLERPAESNDTQSMVAALSALLGDLAREIAAELSKKS